MPSMAVRRTARLRREYLYRKSLEGKEKEVYERKERLRAALQGALSGQGLGGGSLGVTECVARTTSKVGRR